MPPKISTYIRDEVRLRADSLCEYCHTDEKWQLVQFTIDHIIPLSAGGKTESDNLALACFHCNRRKSNTFTIIDPATKKVTLLFHPRKMKWNEHFYWSNDALRLMPKSEIGRVTIDHLQLNRERIIHIRSADILVDRHPPKKDLLTEE